MDQSNDIDICLGVHTNLCISCRTRGVTNNLLKKCDAIKHRVSFRVSQYKLLDNKKYRGYV